LLEEVRRLRVAIETMVSTGARVQIVFGRLQLQEQRTASAARRLDELRDRLSNTTAESGKMAGMVQEIEERLRDSSIAAETRKQLDGELGAVRRVVAQMEVERQRLQTEEGNAAIALATEQGRWADLNQQLEELERTLARRQD
jgi:chromosome segregation ATPase